MISSLEEVGRCQTLIDLELSGAKVAFDFQRRKIFVLRFKEIYNVEYQVFSVEGLLQTSKKVNGTWPVSLTVLDSGAVFVKSRSKSNHYSCFKEVTLPPLENRSWIKAGPYLFSEETEKIVAWSSQGSPIGEMTKSKKAKLYSYGDKAVIKEGPNVSLLQVDKNGLTQETIFTKDSTRHLNSKIITVGEYSVFLENHFPGNTAESFVYFKEKLKPAFVGWSQKDMSVEGFWADGDEVFIQDRDIDGKLECLLHNWKERKDVFHLFTSSREDLTQVLFHPTKIILGFEKWSSSTITIINRKSGKRQKRYFFDYKLHEMALHQNKIYALIGAKLGVINIG